MKPTQEEIDSTLSRPLTTAEQKELTVLWKLLSPNMPYDTYSKYLDEKMMNELGKAISKVYRNNDKLTPVHLLANIRAALAIYIKQLIKGRSLMELHEFQEENR